MANILLTETCVRSCPYCFAKQYMSDSDVKDALTWDNLIYIADFLLASGERHISLLGGEPLIHPEIAEIILYLNKRGLAVTVFTSGIMPDSKFGLFVEKLYSSPNLMVAFVCNVNDPKLSSKSEVEKVKRFFTAFGSMASLSFNIYRLDFEMEFLKGYIIEYGLNRHIRLGLAHPIPGKKNKYIEPKDFCIVKDKLLGYFEEFEKLGIDPGFDCGFPMCMFDDTELGKVFKYTVGQASFQCGPAIDVGTDLNVWSCFPLSDFKKKSLLDFNSYQEIADFYGQEMERVRTEVGGIYPSCDTCRYRVKHLCSGGCLAHVLNKFIEEGGFRHEKDMLSL